MPTLTEALIALVVVVLAACGGAALGYRYATGQQAKAELKVEQQAATNTQKVEAANAAAVAPVIKEVEVIKWKTQTLVK